MRILVTLSGRPWTAWVIEHASRHLSLYRVYGYQQRKMELQ